MAHLGAGEGDELHFAVPGDLNQVGRPDLLDNHVEEASLALLRLSARTAGLLRTATSDRKATKHLANLVVGLFWRRVSRIVQTVPMCCAMLSAGTLS